MIYETLFGRIRSVSEDDKAEASLCGNGRLGNKEVDKGWSVVVPKVEWFVYLWRWSRGIDTTGNRTIICLGLPTAPGTARCTG